MKKIWLVMCILLLVPAAIAAVILSTQLKVVSQIENENVEVLSNKTWKIYFSRKLDQKTVNSQTVSVINDQGEKQDIDINLSDDQKSIIVKPPESGYKARTGSYKLLLTEDIQSVNGRRLASQKEQLFSVELTLPKAESVAQINDHFLTLLGDKGRSKGFGLYSDASSAEDSSMESSGEGGQYSETNIQVEGVDEADSVKTDGQYIYRATDGEVQIVSAHPVHEMEVMSVLKFTHDFSPHSLFLHENQLVVLGHSYTENKKGTENKVQDISFPAYYQSVKAIVYDIENKKQPKVIREVEVEGSLTAARMKEGKVFMVTSQYPDIWMLEEKPDMDLRPIFKDTAKAESFERVDLKNINYIPESKDQNFTNIAVFDLNQNTKEAVISSFIGSGDNMYMSKDYLYIASADYSLMPLREESFEDFSPDTTIYKFKFEGLKAVMMASAEINGTILNQFSMDEHDGYFRIATTKGNTFNDSTPSANNLYILDENLNETGNLEDLARGERIYSARFMGDKIYIVTFKETDPLFVIDSSNPRSPKVLGELKIPGFSNYLHPYDENHLIGFGYDTRVEAGKNGSDPLVFTEGIKISLFDVSDMKNPKEKFTEIIGGRGTYSPLNYDHKALLFDKNKDIFAFPITVYENMKDNQYDSKFTFQGAYIYGIDVEKGFTIKEMVTHQDQDAIYEEWEDTIDRLVYINNVIYALSPNAISAYDMDSYRRINFVEIN
ncbi:MAG: beta-propeller domain-containing protein [Cytobacillus gottheilii]